MVVECHYVISMRDQFVMRVCGISDSERTEMGLACDKAGLLVQDLSGDGSIFMRSSQSCSIFRQ